MTGGAAETPTDAYRQTILKRNAYASAKRAGADPETLERLRADFNQSNAAYANMRLEAAGISAAGGGGYAASIHDTSHLGTKGFKPMDNASAKAAMATRTKKAKTARKSRFDAWEREQIRKERQATSLFR